MPLTKNAQAAVLLVALLAAGGTLADAAEPTVGAGPTPSAVKAGVPTVRWATDPDDEWMGLPEGPGREAVFYTCPACHSLMLVRQQGLDRATWDETLEWMVEEQAMDPMDPKDRELALDYLAEWYGPDRKALNQKP